MRPGGSRPRRRGSQPGGGANPAAAARGVGGGACACAAAAAAAAQEAARAAAAAEAARLGRAQKQSRGWQLLGAGAAFWAAAAGLKLAFPDPLAESDEDETVVNWSATHEVRTRLMVHPETTAEAEAAVRAAHASGRKLRVVGSALSPNAIGLSAPGMVCLSQCDRVLAVDKEKMTVTVEAGARVEQVTEALREHGLTLQNYASIREQQIGGFISVGAHGTGAAIPPVDMQVLSLKLATPAKGTLELSAEKDPALFRLATCGLGALGLITEVTLQCVPAHKLVERTFVASARQIRRNHAEWLRQNRHMRYMWLPYTGHAVVVQCNPLAPGAAPPPAGGKVPDAERTAPLRKLLLEVAPQFAPEEAAGMSFSELRDHLLAAAPLDAAHVRRVNRAELEFWRRSEGLRMDWSDRILGFDCGGQQWVLELAFPTGSLERPSGADLEFVDGILRDIEREKVPAPCPIEQRWTAGSANAMSPARSADPAGSVHSWVGIIMYLPTEDPAQRDAITRAFGEYGARVMRRQGAPADATEHWAKIELPDDPAARAAMRARLRARFPVEAFNAARRELDPKNVLANDVIDGLFPLDDDDDDEA